MGSTGRRLSALVAGASLLCGCRPRREPPALTPNLTHLVWRVQGHDYFVRSNGRYRTNPGLLALGAAPVEFDEAKPKDTLRIVCIGGSTTHGWPFQERLSYPALLGALLRDALPSPSVEVINAGVNGSDSTSDVGLLRELRPIRPDLVILYEGRNEARNLPLHVGWRARALSLHAWLLQRSSPYARFWCWLEAARPYDRAAAERAWAGRSIREYQTEMKPLFRSNMFSLIAEARQAGAQVVVLTQVVSSEERSWNTSILAVNRWIREIAAEKGTWLIDLDGAFRDRSRTERDLIIPPLPVHPDRRGYELMARLIARGLAERGWPAAAAGWRWQRVHPDSYYERSLGADEAYLSRVYDGVAVDFERLGEPKLASHYRVIAARFRSHPDPEGAKK